MLFYTKSIGTDNMQVLLDKILTELTNLKTLYIFVCPAQKLSIKSKSLEKVCIYKSEFVDLRSLDLPNLKVLMLHEGLIELFFKAHQVQTNKLTFLTNWNQYIYCLDNNSMFKYCYTKLFFFCCITDNFTRDFTCSIYFNDQFP